MFLSVRTCGSLQEAFSQVTSECLCFAFSFVLRAGLDQSAIPSKIKFSKAIALQEYGSLDGPALAFAERYGIGPHDVDPDGWSLLHLAVKTAENTPSMIEVVHGLLREMSVE